MLQLIQKPKEKLSSQGVEEERKLVEVIVRLKRRKFPKLVALEDPTTVAWILSQTVHHALLPHRKKPFV